MTGSVGECGVGGGGACWGVWGGEVTGKQAHNPHRYRGEGEGEGVGCVYWSLIFKIDTQTC